MGGEGEGERGGAGREDSCGETEAAAAAQPPAAGGGGGGAANAVPCCHAGGGDTRVRCPRPPAGAAGPAPGRSQGRGAIQQSRRGGRLRPPCPRPAAVALASPVPSPHGPSRLSVPLRPRHRGLRSSPHRGPRRARRRGPRRACGAARRRGEPCPSAASPRRSRSLWRSRFVLGATS